MNRTPLEKRTQILHLLCEGNSIRATTRIADVSKNTVVKLLADVGTACLAYQDENLRGLDCKRLQCDELWSFCYAKEKNVPEDKKGVVGYGDVWTWTAICAESKLIPCWHLGGRTADDAHSFMLDLADRMNHRVQLTTDGHKAYLDAAEDAFGTNIDYGMLVKMYGNLGSQTPERKYSPDAYTGSTKQGISGNPDRKHISTSYVERSNLTMRMNMRRFTRLTNGFSKKVENLGYALALHFMYYNFVRIHQSLRVTPAMAAGVTSHVWEVEDIAKLVDGK